MTVTKWRIRLRFHEPINEERILDPAMRRAIIPEVEHDVKPLDDDTEFYIEFFRGVGQ